jgi:hypothetical protein
VHAHERVIFAIAPDMAGIAVRHPLARSRAKLKLLGRLGLDWILIKVLRQELWKPLDDVAYRYSGGDTSAYVASNQLEASDIEEARQSMNELIGLRFRILSSLRIG